VLSGNYRPSSVFQLIYQPVYPRPNRLAGQNNQQYCPTQQDGDQLPNRHACYLNHSPKYHLETQIKIDHSLSPFLFLLLSFYPFIQLTFSANWLVRLEANGQPET